MSLFDEVEGKDWDGTGVWVDSLVSVGVGVGDPDGDEPITEGDGNDSDEVSLDGMAPSGPAPVCRGSGLSIEVVCGGDGLCVVIGGINDGDGSADELASGMNSLVVVGVGSSVDS